MLIAIIGLEGTAMIALAKKLVSVQFPPLAVSVAVHAFDAERRAAAPLLLSAGQQSIDISCWRLHSSKPAAAACSGR